MKAIQFQAVGEPSQVLRLVDLRDPQPGPGEVCVRMLASPVNPSDLMFIRGGYTIPAKCPAVPGFEGVGIVESSGGGLRGRLFVGRRVVVLNQKGGNWAERAVVPSSQVIPVSSSLSNEQAATFFVNPATAWVMTREVLSIPQGALLVQSAAGSALGRMIIRLARHSGFRTINIVRQKSVGDELLALGADHVVVCDGSHDNAMSLTESLNRLTNGQGVSYAVDAVGGETGSAIVRALGQAGRMLAFGTLSGQPLQFSPRTLMTTGATVEGFWLGNYMRSQSLVRKLTLVRRLTRLIRSGILQTPIRGQWKLEDWPQAVTHAEDSSSHGKCLLAAGDRV